MEFVAQNFSPQWIQTPGISNSTRLKLSSPRKITIQPNIIFMTQCRKYLSQRPLPIGIKFTGDISIHPKIFGEPNGWCFDELGRLVILLNGHLIFQHHRGEDFLIFSTNGEWYQPVTGADLAIFSQLINS